VEPGKQIWIYEHDSERVIEQEGYCQINQAAEERQPKRFTNFFYWAMAHQTHACRLILQDKAH
jgi:hypothetical protein